MLLLFPGRSVLAVIKILHYSIYSEFEWTIYYDHLTVLRKLTMALLLLNEKSGTKKKKKLWCLWQQ